MVRARLISTEGPYHEAVIETCGQRLHVMDEFSVCEDACPRIGEEFEFEFYPFLGENEEWEAIFAGNPSGHVGLEHLGGWRYRAFGKVVGVNPVVVDCGLFTVEDVVSSSDARLVGESVAFIISRLGGYACKT